METLLTNIACLDPRKEETTKPSSRKLTGP